MIEDTALPLAGLRVVDFGVWHAGPGAAAILADLGADVIKVESPRGDPERHHGDFAKLEGKSPVSRPDWNLLFEMSNRNKRGVEVDLDDPGDRAFFDRLVKSSDVFITNLRRSSLERLGTDAASVTRSNPAIVHVTVSAFGPRGPLSELGGFDPLGQALSGLMYLAGGDEPRLLSIIVLDQLTAIAASHAALAALVARGTRGSGGTVHVSLLGSAVWLQHANLLASSVATSPLDLAWDRSTAAPLRNTFRCGDGRWIMGANHPPDRFWSTFCTAIGRPYLLSDPRFADPGSRRDHARALLAELDSTFLQHPRDHWLDVLRAAGLLFTRINTLDEALDDPQLTANEYVTLAHHPLLGDYRAPGYPAHFGGAAIRLRRTAPGRGQHTQEVEAELDGHG